MQCLIYDEVSMLNDSFFGQNATKLQKNRKTTSMTPRTCLHVHLEIRLKDSGAVPYSAKEVGVYLIYLIKEVAECHPADAEAFSLNPNVHYTFANFLMAEIQHGFRLLDDLRVENGDGPYYIANYRAALISTTSMTSSIFAKPVLYHPFEKGKKKKATRRRAISSSSSYH
ncbi:unnamed protein product [Vitrella brassicaformis CCMP3155]|uniref:Uncharacterized protein n=1 Tax=Vitrella brassicaformis (strain CCMP3155) TaxID=1169540 RepID=A0A0G4E9C5_VITBC|nr:unnamed protein product [Vitrella brassicaformis CCMP3155]|eukprot:CEL92466.1 unnamed protein product [Vitrella brassicaformis CCMP3155]